MTDDDFQKIEFLNDRELAGKLKVLPSWVKEMRKPSRTSDPIPTVKVGKHKRYPWLSPAMRAWLSRRGLH